jgi:hypothetical protein
MALGRPKTRLIVTPSERMRMENENENRQKKLDSRNVREVPLRQLPPPAAGTPRLTCPSAGA